MPTEAEKIVKTTLAPLFWMADSSAVTSVALSDGCHVPTSSIPSLGIVAWAALIMPSVQAAFSATMAHLMGTFNSFFITAPAMARWAKLVRTR